MVPRPPLVSIWPGRSKPWCSATNIWCWPMSATRVAAPPSTRRSVRTISGVVGSSSGGADGDAGRLGKAQQVVGGLRHPHAVASDDDGSLGGFQQREGLLEGEFGGR